MRRWERPIQDFLAPCFRGAVSRLTGENIISGEVEHRRDLDTLTDMLNYLRDLRQAVRDPEHRGIHFFAHKTRCLPGRATYMSSRARASRPGPPVRRRGQELPPLQCRSKPLPWFLLLIQSRRGENSSPSGVRLSMCPGVPSPSLIPAAARLEERSMELPVGSPSPGVLLMPGRKRNEPGSESGCGLRVLLGSHAEPERSTQSRPSPLFSARRSGA